GSAFVEVRPPLGAPALAPFVGRVGPWVALEGLDVSRAKRWSPGRLAVEVGGALTEQLAARLRGLRAGAGGGSRGGGRARAGGGGGRDVPGRRARGGARSRGGLHGRPAPNTGPGADAAGEPRGGGLRAPGPGRGSGRRRPRRGPGGFACAGGLGSPGGGGGGRRSCRPGAAPSGLARGVDPRGPSAGGGRRGPVTVQVVQDGPSDSSTDRTFPAGSVNQAMVGPSPRKTPCSSVL